MRLDWKIILGEGSTNTEQKIYVFNEKNDNRSCFKKDFDAICFWSSLRRLQDKAQVFPLEEGDFPRTRLTHSLEVMSISEALGAYLVELIIKKEQRKILNETGEKKEYENSHLWLDRELYKKIWEIPLILRSASLIHDLGNPPFGHISEKTISKWFTENLSKYKLYKDDFIIEKVETDSRSRRHANDIYLADLLGDDLRSDLEGFDGNAEVLRIVSRLQNRSPHRTSKPIKLSLPLMATIIKYPIGFLEKRYPDNKKMQKKKGFFQSESDYYNEIQTQLKLNNNRHPLAFLLEAADDIAYLISDFEDAVVKGLISLNDLELVLKCSKEDDIKNLSKPEVDIVSSHDVDKFIALFNENFKRYKDKFKMLKKSLKAYKEEGQHVASKKICIRLRGFFIARTKEEMGRQYEKIMEGNYHSNLLETSSAGFLASILSELLKKRVYYSEQITKKKIEGVKAINTLLDSFVPAVINSYGKPPNDDTHFINSNLISRNFMEICKDRLKDVTDDKTKIYELLFLVIDYISGMTDSYAIKICQVFR